MKDVNNAMLKKAGFERDLNLDGPKFNTLGRISYWKNKRGVRVITKRDKKMSLEELVNHIINHSSYLVREELRKKIMSCEYQDLIK